MKLCDNHMHSSCSFDAENSVEEMCLSAIDKGLYAISITDHCEAWLIGKGEECEFGDFSKRIPKSNKLTEQCAEKYKDKIKILKGLELGEPMHNPELTKIALSYGNFDFILASVHNIRNTQDFYHFQFTKDNVDEYLTKYFKEVLETASFKYFDSFAHLTYPIKYIIEKTNIDYKIEKHIPVIDEIFKTLISNNKALEINTSGMRSAMNCTLPDMQIIKRYRDLGGEFITIGSDSHNVYDVGKNIADAVALAKQCGFEFQTIFENHKPIQIQL